MTAILFFILIALFPLGVLTKFSILPSVHIAAADVVITLILLASLKKIVLFLIHKKSTMINLFILFFMTALLGVLMNTDNLFQFTSSFSYLLRLYAYILLLIPLMDLPVKKLHEIRIGMIISGLVFILLGYVQYIYYPNLRNLFYLGWDEHLYRLFSTFLDPNFAGTFILLVLFLYISFFMEKIKFKDIKLNAFFTLPFLIIIPALFLTYSRSALLTGAVMTIIFLTLIGQKKLIAVVCGMLILLLFILPKNFGGEGVNLMRTASIMTRLNSNSQAIKIFQDNPIIGVGFNTLRFTQDKYNYLLKSEVLTSHAAAGFPNSFLVMLATTGVIGFSLFTVIFYKTTRHLYFEMKRRKDYFYFYASILTVILGVLFNSMFENVLFYAPVMVWLVLLIGISKGVEKNN